MIRYAVLGSGSSANSYIFEKGNSSFIIDNGFTAKELLRRMKALGFDPRKLEFIFLTHIHTDHLKGVERLSVDLQIPVVINQSLPIHQYVKGELYKTLSIVPGKEYCSGKLTFSAFETYHDAPSSLSYYFDFGCTKVTVITDTGKFDENMIDMAASSHILFLESNYSEEMLEQGTYPPFLKQRIRSEHGHLSNYQSAEFIKLITDREEYSLEQIYLCHLSKNNNSVDKVREEIGEDCGMGIPVRICDRGEMVPGNPIQANKSNLVPGGSSSESISYSEISAR